MEFGVCQAQLFFDFRSDWFAWIRSVAAFHLSQTLYLAVKPISLAHCICSLLTVCCGLNGDSHDIVAERLSTLCIYIMSQFKFKLLFCCAYRLNENSTRFNIVAAAAAATVVSCLEWRVLYHSMQITTIQCKWMNRWFWIFLFLSHKFYLFVFRSFVFWRFVCVVFSEMFKSKNGTTSQHKIIWLVQRPTQNFTQTQFNAKRKHMNYCDLYIILSIELYTLLFCRSYFCIHRHKTHISCL